MISVIFLVFLWSCSPTLAIHCFSTDKKSALFKISEVCTFQMDMNDPFPDETQLTNNHNCRQYNLTNATYQFYCFAEATIDYHNQSINIALDYISSLDNNSYYQTTFEKYDSHTRKRTRYFIEGELVNSTLTYTMSVMCMTHDNCAMDELRKFLSIELARTDQRMTIFKQLKSTMEKPSSTNKSPNLM